MLQRCTGSSSFLYFGAGSREDGMVGVPVTGHSPPLLTVHQALLLHH